MPKALKPPVYIESQVTRRDLQARLLLGARLAAWGHPVMLGRDHAMFAAAAVNPPGIYLSDWGFTHAAATRLATVRSWGHLPYGQCEESTAYVAPDLYQKIRLVPAALGESTAVFCTNGQQQALIEDQLAGQPLPSLLNTGNIRFELLGSSLRAVYDKDVAKLKRQYGDFVLLTTNGKLRNVSDVAQTVAHLHRDLGLTEPDAQRFGALIEQRAEAQRRFIQDALAVAKDLPAQTFVLRAKYNEIRPIRELFGEALPNNVTLANSGGIQPWVLAARAVVMNNCTTGMDAFVADTPSLFYRPAGDTVENLEGPAALSTGIEGQAALHAALAEELPSNPMLDEATIAHLMPSLRQDSHREIAQHITQRAADLPAYERRFEVPIAQRLPLWKKAVLHRLSPSRSLGGRVVRQDVFEFMTRLKSLDPSLKDVKLRQLDFELYCLSL